MSKQDEERRIRAAASSLGMTQEQVARDIRALHFEVLNPRTHFIASALGITNSQEQDSRNPESAFRHSNQQGDPMGQVLHDPEQVAKNMADALFEQFNVLLEGAEALRPRIQAISTNLALAARTGRQELMEACQDQLALAVEESKLQARSSALEPLVDYTVQHGVTLLVQGAFAGLKGLRVGP